MCKKWRATPERYNIEKELNIFWSFEPDCLAIGDL